VRLRSPRLRRVNPLSLTIQKVTRLLSGVRSRGSDSSNIAPREQLGGLCRTDAAQSAQLSEDRSLRQSRALSSQE
jgi:hypothetical protein